MNEKLCTTFREIGSCNFNDVLIVGDFNFPEIDWKTESCTAGTGHAAYRFLESARDAFLTQHQCEPIPGIDMGSDQISWTWFSQVGRKQYLTFIYYLSSHWKE